MELIELKNVDLSFKTKTQKIEIYRDLNISFKNGEFTAIVGPSGMGKSTLLNLISGFVKPNKGEIIINGNNLMKLNDKEICKYRNESIGYIFQTFNLIPQFNVRDNIMVPLLLNSNDKNFINKRVAELLDMIKMTNREYEYPNTLSGGEQQRVAFARAIANSPEIILADEPTGNLDSKNSDKLIDMLYELCKKESKTIICVTHDDKLMDKADVKINIEDIVYSE